MRNYWSFQEAARCFRGFQDVLEAFLEDTEGYKGRLRQVFESQVFKAFQRKNDIPYIYDPVSINRLRSIVTLEYSITHTQESSW